LQQKTPAGNKKFFDISLDEANTPIPPRVRFASRRRLRQGQGSSASGSEPDSGTHAAHHRILWPRMTGPRCSGIASVAASLSERIAPGERKCAEEEPEHHGVDADRPGQAGRRGNAGRPAHAARRPSLIRRRMVSMVERTAWR
jgi:hypothetical protein